MDLSVLNKEQKEAVEYNEGPLLIIAGAGSGKTKAITYKIAYLIDKGVDPRDILAITFTNKAADEMKNRVEMLLNDNNKRVFISTFHKFCGRILKAYIDSIGYDTNYSIYDTSDQNKLMSQILKDLNLSEKKIKERAILSKISYCKNHNISIEEYEKSAKSDIEKTIVKCFYEYEKRKFDLNIVDFDDMLLFAVKILKQNNKAREELNERFKYILVDEYQDTNMVQFELIKLLREKYQYLTVVGDDDQSIYKFRGADINNILSFEKQFQNAKIIKLTQNYRSTNNILNVANVVIKNNKGRKDKNLWSENGDGSKVIFTEYQDDYAEALNIMNEIKKNNDYKNTAILFRTNVQSRRLEELCVSLGIPYMLIGGVEFYERKEVKDIISYLKVIANKKDEVALIRIINVPKRGIGETTVKKFLDYARNNNISLFESLSFAEEVGIKGKTKNAIEDFVNVINIASSKNDIADMIEITKEDGGYIEFLIEEYGQSEAKERIENIDELKNKSFVFKNTYGQNEEDELIKEYKNNITGIELLNEFLHDVSLVSDLDNLDESVDKLTLMTLHSSKGLEYDNIYLIGMNEGLFPSYQAIQSDDKDELEEERRLCYVGITRAKKNLYLSSSRRRLINGSYNEYPISRFVEEMNIDAIEKKELKNNNYDAFDIDYGYNRYKKNYSNNNYNSYYKNKKVSDEEKIINTNNSKKNDDTFSNMNVYKLGKNLPKPNLDFDVGDKVSHIKFGEGKVLNIEDVGKDYEITVDFEDVGEKVLYQSFAKLVKV